MAGTAKKPSTRAAKKTSRKSPPRRRPSKAPPPMTVAAAVQRDLDDLARWAPELATSGLAATALRLARDIDSESNSATSHSMCANALRDTMNQLRELAPPAEEEDGIDDLAKRRASRIAGEPAAGSRARRRAAP